MDPVICEPRSSRIIKAMMIIVITVIATILMVLLLSGFTKLSKFGSCSFEVKNAKKEVKSWGKDCKITSKTP